MRPRDLQNILAFFGTFIRMFAVDIEKCFRNNPNHVELLHLFVYCILTSEFGVEIFVDKSNPFGWKPAEWGWQTVLAILKWCLHRLMFKYPKMAGPTRSVSTVLSNVDVGSSAVVGPPSTLPEVSLGVSPSSGFMVYVDNFFAWAPATDFVDMHTKLQALIAKFGLPLHELQLDGRLFTALGLIFDASTTDRWYMVLPEDKFVILMRYLKSGLILRSPVCH